MDLKGPYKSSLSLELSLLNNESNKGLGLPVLKTVALHSPLLLEPTEMAAMTQLCAPRLEHYILLGPLGQVVALPPCNTPLPY
ncbi:hypothetical protein J6590_081532 [Homalodisca vitripennis]|nr:hypothetical protein J6590_081532 [Homalodisca vitripennis]